LAELKNLKLITSRYPENCMRGSDVRTWQESLKKLGYKLDIDGVFGKETDTVTKQFQKDAGITVDGIVGKQSRDVMNKKLNALLKPVTSTSINYLPASDYPQIDAAILAKINTDLQGLSETRIKVVQEALKTVYPYGLYIRGGNSYTTALKPNYVTAEMIKRGADRQPEYYNGGRKEFMLNHIRNMNFQGKQVFGLDCSGNPVGIWRKLKLVDNNFDNTANGILLNTCYHIKKNELKPADCVGKEKHMAIYVGAGLCVEAVGGAYGVELTDLNTRKVFNQMTGKIETKPQWYRYGRPKFY
jgi:peptidoglycan hydrolase-like protein with peptidoglycan-binding domain